MKQHIRSKDQIDEMFGLLATRCKAFWDWNTHPIMEIDIKPTRERRSLDQNALYWVWMEAISTYFSRNGRPLTKDQASKLMRHEYLGYNTETIGQTKTVELIGTSTLKVDEFTTFLDQIDAWAADKGCLLEMPADVDYKRQQARQGKGGK